MNGVTEFVFGVAVDCDDHECGQLRSAVVDPVKLEITHLVVRPRGREDDGRLVPVDLVRTSTAQRVRLGCTHAQYEALDGAQTTDVLPGPGDAELRQQTIDTVLAYHVYGHRPDLGIVTANPSRRTEPVTLTHDNLPSGEGEVGRGQHVHASDGDIGHVRGLLAGATGHRVTHVLLDEGHLWGKKEVAVPVGAVKEVVDSGVYLGLTRKEVGDLPPVATRTG